MFIKNTTFEILENGFEVIDSDLVKVASADILPDGMNYDPEFLYLYVKAVSAGEYYGDNKNNDFFPEEELKGWYKTFLTAHAFKNHENKDIKNAIGDVISAVWEEDMKCVKLLIRIDRRIAPSIVRGYEKGYMTDVSMGCRVSYVVCPICNTKAKTRQDYCQHLLYQKGQILEDGRKVYEININPKFHDISAVLNGAEKTAKAERIGLQINGSSVSLNNNIAKAARPISNNMEKAASFNSISKKVDYEPDIEFSLNKRAGDISKIAEIKKDIQARIEHIIKGKMMNKEVEIPDSACDDIKVHGEKYMDKKDTDKIVEKINSIAEKNMASPVEVFLSFLNVMTRSGVMLTPLEFVEIYSSVSGNAIPDMRGASIPKLNIMPSHIGDISLRENSEALNLSGALHLISSIIRKPDSLGENPDAGIVKVIIRRGSGHFPQSNCSKFDNEVFSNFSHIIPNRSSAREFLPDRLIKMASSDMDKDNSEHFDIFSLRNSNTLLKTASYKPVVLCMHAYMAYQNDIAYKIAQPDFADSLEKSAMSLSSLSDIEKVAKRDKNPWGAGKALLYGIPLTYGYSALQRARINKGENVSTGNRFIAENPGNLSLVQLALAPTMGKKLGAVQKTKGKNVVEKIDNILLDKFASFKDNDSMNKISSSIDIFSDNNLDKSLISKGYLPAQLGIIKSAAIDISVGREDIAQEKLASVKLNTDAVLQFLKIAEELVKIDIESSLIKTADFGLKEIGFSAASDILFNPKGVSSLAMLPGNIVDGIVFSKLTSSGKTKKPTEPASVNNLKGEYRKHDEIK